MEAGISRAIVSEDYADLMIEYDADLAVLEAFQDAEINIINALYAVVSIPVEMITSNIITELGYETLPICFGIVSFESLEASGVQRLRNFPAFNLRGQGVLIGIVDTGIDYTNPIFRYADGSTRIAAIWDQTIISENVPSGIGYGTIYTREQIDEALRSEDPFAVVPSRDEIGHGTMIAGIAAGNEVPENNFYGIAADAEFVVVKLKQAKQFLRDFFFIPEGAVCFQETDLMFGIRFLLDMRTILQKPMSIGIGLGSSMGGHDGRGIISRYFSLAATRNGLSIVVAAGNEGNERRHFLGEVNPVIGYDTIELNVGENETGFSMEIWGRIPSLYSLDIQTPSGEYIPQIVASRDENRIITFIFEETIIYLDYQIVEGQSGDQLILLRFSAPSPGIWRFNVYERGDISRGFNAWLPMEGFISDDTYFIRSNPYTTILSPGNADIPITVTAYNTDDDSLFYNAGRGYTRVGTIKPDIAAPGVNVEGPDLNQGFIEYTGTSPAVAHTAGIAALLLEWGIVRGNLPAINTVVIKKLLIRGAKRNVDIIYPNRDWGYGILDIYEVFNSLRTELIM
jgi:subtilisin family serine protease